MTQPITEKTLKDIMNSKAVVKFTASWCGPCQRIAKDIKDACEKNEFMLLEIDIDEYGEIADAFKINSVPVTYICNNGKRSIVKGADMKKITECMDEAQSRGVVQITGDIPMM